MDPSARPPGSVIAYAQRLTGRLMNVSGGLLQAAYLHGSAALGGWVEGRSDVDMLLVTADGIDSTAVEGMTQTLLEAAGECPGRELECRALTYLTDQKIVSKIAGGEAALRRGAGPAEVVQRALDQQRGSEPDRPPGRDAIGFVLATAAVLRSAADEPSG